MVLLACFLKVSRIVSFGLIRMIRVRRSGPRNGPGDADDNARSQNTVSSRIDVRLAGTTILATCPADRGVRAGAEPGFYSEVETESAIRYVFGVDSTLIDDGTYFGRTGRVLAGCGGWTRRSTLARRGPCPVGEASLLDPTKDCIRAFLSHRRRLGRRRSPAAGGVQYGGVGGRLSRADAHGDAARSSVLHGAWVSPGRGRG